MGKYIIDANVVLLAGTPVKDIPSDQLLCAQKCIKFINNFVTKADNMLVLDAEGRIMKEYRGLYSLDRDPNIATVFYRWACRNVPKNAEDFISLKEIAENEFESYPDSEQLKRFDPPDRKYIALAFQHKEHPPIVEANDSKWWGIREEMERCGLNIRFIDETYIKEKYAQKMGH